MPSGAVAKIKVFNCKFNRSVSNNFVIECVISSAICSRVLLNFGIARWIIRSFKWSLVMYIREIFTTLSVLGCRKITFLIKAIINLII